MKIQLPLLLSLTVTLSFLAPLEAREPTELEQYYLELINRARANPDGEVSRQSAHAWGNTISPASPALNEGLAPNTISNAAKPPLAFNRDIIDATRNYADLLLRREAFDNVQNGIPAERMHAEGYIFRAPTGNGENLAITSGPNGSNRLNPSQVAEHHRKLFIDRNVSNRLNRQRLMEANFREVGISIREDSDEQSVFGGRNNSDIITVQDFAYSLGRIFVTGVIFRDKNGNGLFTANNNEAIGTMLLKVRDSGGNLVKTATTFRTGGYAINMAGQSTGNYTLVVETLDGDRDSTTFFWNNSINVKVDMIDPDFEVDLAGYQPDLSIIKPNFGRFGNNNYAFGGNSQRVILKSSKRKKRTWTLNLQNDGSIDDLVRVRGSKGNKLFRVTYRQRISGSFRNVSSSILRGRNVTLANRSAESFRIEITPTSRTKGRKKKKTFSFTGTSTNDSSKNDLVKARIEMIK